MKRQRRNNSYNNCHATVDIVYNSGRTPTLHSFIVYFNLDAPSLESALQFKADRTSRPVSDYDRTKGISGEVANLSASGSATRRISSLAEKFGSR